jgi:hypothetical protein
MPTLQSGSVRVHWLPEDHARASKQSNRILECGDVTPAASMHWHMSEDKSSPPCVHPAEWENVLIACGHESTTQCVTSCEPSCPERRVPWRQPCLWLELETELYVIFWSWRICLKLGTKLKTEVKVEAKKESQNIIETCSEVHRTSFPMGTGGSFPEGKVAGAWSWPPTSS